VPPIPRWSVCGRRERHDLRGDARLDVAGQKREEARHLGAAPSARTHSPTTTLRSVEIGDVAPPTRTPSSRVRRSGAAGAGWSCALRGTTRRYCEVCRRSAFLVPTDRYRAIRRTLERCGFASVAQWIEHRFPNALGAALRLGISHAVPASAVFARIAEGSWLGWTGVVEEVCARSGRRLRGHAVRERRESNGMCPAGVPDPAMEDIVHRDDGTSLSSARLGPISGGHCAGAGGLLGARCRCSLAAPLRWCKGNRLTSGSSTGRSRLAPPRANQRCRHRAFSS
jgi:hypothetical protein